MTPQRLLPRRLGTQLMLWVAGALLLSLALLGAYTIQQQTARARAGIDDLARSLARTLALASENPILLNRLDLLEHLLLQSSALPEVLDLQVIDARGQELSHVHRESGQDPQLVFDARPRHDTAPAGTGAELRQDLTAVPPLAIAWQPIGNGQHLGWVRVGYSLESLDAIARGIWLNTVVAGVLTSLVASLLVAAALRQPLRALHRAREFAAELVQADGAQMPVPASPAEVRALTRALNSASRRLHGQRKVIHGHMQQLQDQDARLGATNEQLQTVFAFSPNGLASFDAQGRIVLANEALHHLLGLPSGALEQQHASQLEAQLHAIARDADPPSLDSLFQPPEAPAAGSRAPAGAPRQTLAVHLPGISQLELTGQHTPGASTPRLLHVRDVTHESEMERLKGEFLSTAAHELRTPIVSIYGFVELLMLRDFPPDRRQKMLATVHRQSAILIEIVNDLLDLSRIEAAGAADCELQAADPLAVVRSVVQGFRPSPVTRPGPEVIVEGPLASVHIDPGKFAQVLRNLLSNAYKYSPQGGEVRVRLGMAPGEGGTPQVRIAVEDEGIGMTPAQLARVFERFYRADASGNIPGTGLGMSIVKDIVELLGGQVHVHSQAGAGTTVTVTLPAVSVGAFRRAADPCPL